MVKQRTIYIMAAVIVVLISVNGFALPRRTQPGGPVTYGGLDPLFATTQAYVFPISEPTYLPLLDLGVAKPLLDAKAVLLYDVQADRILFERSKNQKLPIASLTKVLTAVVVRERLVLDDVVTVPASAVRVDGIRQDLSEGEKIKVRDLLTLLLVSSSNDAGAALAENARTRGLDLVALMNEKAVSLGMTDSHFLDPQGLNDGAYSTAEDLVKIVVYATRYPELWDLMSKKEATVTSVDGKIHAVHNTDELLGVLPNLVGGKTGYTDGALGCLMLVVDIPDKHDTIISIVLGSPDRFDDSKRLVDWALKAYRW